MNAPSDNTVEIFVPTGQLTRAGSFSQLAHSDKECVADALKNHDQAKAISYLELFITNHSGLIYGLTEWSLWMPSTFAKMHSFDEEKTLSEEARALWTAESATLQVCEQSTKRVEELLQICNTDAIVPGVVHNHLKNLGEGKETLATFILSKVLEVFQNLMGAVKTEDYTLAATLLDDYFLIMRTSHDMLIHFISAYSSAILRKHGSDVAVKVSLDSFSSCSFHDGLFQLATALSPDQLAVFYAEHLRSHFSGPLRDGAVRIEEDEDCIRLQFDVCGTGGAIRQRLQDQNLDLIAEASPHTWNRCGEVPVFCAHCAANEMKMPTWWVTPLLSQNTILILQSPVVGRFTRTPKKYLNIIFNDLA